MISKAGVTVVAASRNRDSKIGPLRTWLRRKLQVSPRTRFGDEELSWPVRQQPHGAFVVVVAGVEGGDHAGRIVEDLPAHALDDAGHCETRRLLDATALTAKWA